ncbi:hypothetical protein JW711_00310 [Candidatus Woesearchaeota archaeon]|nr:hypothetical protein [Candidatus Woesearchaeota archaeon]
MAKKKTSKKKASPAAAKDASKKAGKKEAANPAFKPAYGIGLAVVAVIILIIIVVANKQGETSPPADTAMGEQEVCGDSICGAKEAASGSCPSDCKVEKDYESDTQTPADEAGMDDGCLREGEMVPLRDDAPDCCPGLELIDPKGSSELGFAGICTAKCGNGVCDEETESPSNCPDDCEAVMDARPVCAGIGTSKEGWYQNDKILMYAHCAGCVAECKNRDTASEGWYNSCDGKQIKRVCN